MFKLLTIRKCTVLLFVLLIYACGLQADDNRETASGFPALRLNTDSPQKIVVDGLLTEKVWQQAQPASGFRQREPLAGEAATERTEVRILYNDEMLYVGVLAMDSEPDKVIARILQRDKLMFKNFDGTPLFAGDDAVAILFDPFHDQKNGVVFATNPNGAEFDALLTDEGSEFNIDWRAVWEVSAKRIPEGWSAEFAIPFRSLRYPDGDNNAPWGFNVYRTIRRKNEEVLWTSWSRDNAGFKRVSRAGHIHGMTNLPRSRVNLEVKPFALTGLVREMNDNDILESGHKLSSGFDAKWEVRPGLMLDLTYNTDFAQVEADDEQVNLTRFSLFFPEKRDFFLENAGIFDFGSRSIGEAPPFQLFFSRRIGISEDGEIPVIGGARLTGRVGKQTVGFLNIVTEETLDEPVANFAVARIKRDIGRNNYIGAMVTDKRSDLAANTGLGLDASFWLSNALNVQGFFVRTQTDTSGTGIGDQAFRVGLSYQTDRFGIRAQHYTIGPDVRAEMGFVTREDIRRTGGFSRLSFRPGRFGVRVVNLFFGGNYFTDLRGEVQDWDVGPGFIMDWNSGESLGAFFSRSFTRLDEAFDPDDDITVPVGDYDYGQIFWFGGSSNNRPWQLDLSGTYQGYFGGTLLSVNTGLNLAFNSRLATGVQYSHNHVEVPAGMFNADVSSLRLSYSFSTRLFANALLQYNSLSNTLSANVRLNYIHRPGSDLFIVFNEEDISEQGNWVLENRGMVAKLTWLKRL